MVLSFCASLPRLLKFVVMMMTKKFFLSNNHWLIAHTDHHISSVRLTGWKRFISQRWKHVIEKNRAFPELCHLWLIPVCQYSFCLSAQSFYIFFYLYLFFRNILVRSHGTITIAVHKIASWRQPTRWGFFFLSFCKEVYAQVCTLSLFTQSKNWFAVSVYLDSIFQ